MSLHQGAMLAAPLMRPRGGKIVSLSSPGAHRYIEHFGCMGPIKAAVESLTRYLAIELAPDNIQVNAVSAGPIYGELLEKYPEKERLIPYWESLSAGKRLGQESDVASFVMYLLSDAATKITGSVMLVDSGGSQRI
jgi:enoyl-[acyl-carrier-protein] reductase (NADH)